MKRADLSHLLQQTLVPTPDYPGALAIVPPPVPKMVPTTGVEGDLFAAHEALSQLKVSTVGLLNPNLITRTLDRREAVRSSQIEGSNSDVDHLFEYEATGSSEGLPQDVHTTLNYVKALDFGINEVRANGNKAITLELIQEIHRLLMDGDTHYRDTPGSFRSKQNWIGGFNIYDAKIVPPPPDRIREALENLVSAMQYSPPEEDPYSVSVIMRMSIVHAQFELIHPFLDGNGRVGRILLPLMLVAEDYAPAYLAGYMKNHQGDYYKSLGDAQLREQWPRWVKFMARSVRTSCLDAIATAEDLLGIRARWLQQLSGLRSDASALAALDYVLSSPVVTVNKLKDHLKVSFPAANTAIDIMKGKGILTELAKQSRSRVFVAKEVIARLEKTASPEPSTKPRNTTPTSGM